MVTVTRKRFTREEYHRLGELGFFHEEEQVELIRGEIITMPTKKTPHSVCNTRLITQLVLLLGEKAIIRGQEPIIIAPDSEPQPDVVIAINKPDEYLSSHPYPEDILLLIEISDSTLKYDQKTKLPLYSEARIKNYWIINLVDNYLETYQQPFQDLQGNFNYRNKLIILPDTTVAIPEFRDLYLDLTRIFPSKSQQSS
ncbi:Uma2 family endonuclease [Crocosphaera sp. XPORK-15E]|uniref:Uma2 family endonuclease n=1 Tax=Crocosphaera sp. XPORK-15E TaxID=3110247 RepID=UPI002B1FC52A|nr:Uma2 family endonuclease [Crocosphaera sp. XPORK-15E]MEA5533035.1 Uma2 family endonuclease [Crocosphaera sp. XPORK-15E]